MLGAGRSTATARADIGARYSSPDGEAWVRGLRTRVMTYVVLDDAVDWEFYLRLAPRASDRDDSNTGGL
jgi:hypothetical protein